MAWTESDFIERVKHLVRDDAAILTAIQYKFHVEDAVRQYEKRRPLKKVYIVNGDGATSDWDLPSDWIVGYSYIRNIEYPVVTSGKPYYLKKQKDYRLIENDAGIEKIRFYTPPSEKARVLYVNPHSIAADTSTIYVRDDYAVAQLAASLCCEALASYYAQTKKPSVSADVVDYEDKGRMYSERAKDLKARYDEHVPKSRAGAIGDWDMTPSWGDDYIWQEDRR